MPNEINCPKCGAPVAPSARVCPACGQALGSDSPGTTVLAPPAREKRKAPPIINRPDPDAVPPWRWKMLVPLAAIVLLGVLIVSRLGHIDRAQQIADWTHEVGTELQNPASRYWHQDQSSRHGLVLWEGGEDRSVFEAVPLPPGFELDKDDEGRPIRPILNPPSSLREPKGNYYLVRIWGWPFVAFGAAYVVELNEEKLDSFEYKRISFLTARWAMGCIFLMLLVTPVTDAVSTSWYRRKNKEAYETYERRRTAAVYQARQLVTEAREMLQGGELAKALVAISEALDVEPDYGEALELQRLIRSTTANQGSLVASDFAPPAPDVNQVLFLRVVGTPYAYRAQTGADTIRVGRQRPKPSQSPDEQNDLVVRIPASDDRTLRISRRHFEINRIGQEYFVVDHSGGRTKLNGRVLESGRPAKIVTGDRLMIGDAITLEVSIRTGTLQSGARIVQLGHDAGPFDLEATVGDMLTEG